MKVPAKFYRKRALLSDKIAAIVLIAPELTPSRDELPRDKIADPNLRAVLAMALLHRRPERLALDVRRQIGIDYCLRLLDIATLDDGRQIGDKRVYGPKAFAYNLAWYCERLVALQADWDRLEAIWLESQRIKRRLAN